MRKWVSFNNTVFVEKITTLYKGCPDCPRNGLTFKTQETRNYEQSVSDLRYAYTVSTCAFEERQNRI